MTTSDPGDFAIQTDYADYCINPPATHGLYLHWLDLKQALDSLASNEPLRILDYGCGMSPYRGLWPMSQYVRADYIPTPGLDHLLEETGTVPEPDASFDMVLSTQVMEHLRDPGIHLQEVARLLKPGGRFVCTTHGTFHDHGCPWDFQRWTLDGLCRDVEAQGLKVERAAKLSAGPRALMVLLNTHGDNLRPVGGGFSSFVCGCLRKALRGFRAPLNRWAAAAFPASAVMERGIVPEPVFDQLGLYIGVMVVATKP